MFSDLLICRALLTNSRCLRYVAEVEAARHSPGDDARALARLHQQTVDTLYTESVLAREARRLESFWIMAGVEHGAPQSPYLQHLHELRLVLADIGTGGSLVALGQQLALQTPHEADALALRAATQLLEETTPTRLHTGQALNHHLAQDSRLWRQLADVQPLDSVACIEACQHRYRKAFKLSRRARRKDNLSEWLNKKQVKFYAAVQPSAHLMELFQPHLSYKEKAQHWHLEKLASSLRARIGVCDLRNALHHADFTQLSVQHSSVQKAHVVAVVDAQIGRLDARISRLFKKSFAVKPRGFGRSLAGWQTAAEQGARLTLVPLPRRG